ncbi:ribosomal protein S8 [Biscogniauxia mediterranea]|nr:ribosomal protein S8 [Biscogniauxia mediterranea]
MGGVKNFVNLCSHLQNASKARLGLTSFPHSKHRLALLLAMQRAGFLSFVTRGGPQPPDPATIGTHQPEPLTTANVARQRLWVGLKYTNNEPVIGRITNITTAKKVWTANLKQLEKLTRGFDCNYQRGLTLGECLFVFTSRGTLESREAIERKVGGMLLCRVTP